MREAEPIGTTEMALYKRASTAKAEVQSLKKLLEAEGTAIDRYKRAAGVSCFPAGLNGDGGVCPLWSRKEGEIFTLPLPQRPIRTRGRTMREKKKRMGARGGQRLGPRPTPPLYKWIGQWRERRSRRTCSLE